VPKLFTFKIQHYVSKCFAMFWVWVVPLLFYPSLIGICLLARGFCRYSCNFMSHFPSSRKGKLLKLGDSRALPLRDFEYQLLNTFVGFHDLMWALFIISPSLTSS